MSHKDPHSQYYERLNTFLGATNDESERGRVLVAASLIEERLEEILFRRFDAMLQAPGYIAMGGQIIDATVVAALKQRNTKTRSARSRKGAFRRRGETGPRSWCRRTATDAARHDGAQLPHLLDKTNTGSWIWAGEPVSATGSNEPANAYRSAKNEAHLAANGFTSRIHRKKPLGKPMPKRDGAAECGEVRGPCRHRARLRPAEGADGPRHPNHRPRQPLSTTCSASSGSARGQQPPDRAPASGRPGPSAQTPEERSRTAPAALSATSSHERQVSGGVRPRRLSG